MARAQIEITLEGGEPEGNLTRYEPGGSLRGRVRVVPDGDVRCSHLFVRLGWHTEGRGDRDAGKAGEQDVFQGTLSARDPAEYAFDFTLPREPWSFAGHYINIIWDVSVDVDVPWSINPRQSFPFILAPGRRQQAPVEAGDSGYTVVLTALGSQVAQVARVIAAIAPGIDPARLGAEGSGDAVPILQGVTRAEAEDGRQRLAEAGATVEIRPADPAR